jgi:hypothetical protein
VEGLDVNPTRKTALITGVLFIITIVFSIPGALLYGPLLNDPNYIVGPGADSQVALGAFLEIVVAIANIGTAVTLFPILKRQNEGVALGYVASRVVESTLIAVGIISILSVVTLRQDFAAGASADAGSFRAASTALVALHGWTFLLGPGLLAGFGNGLLLGYLMYQSGLVPRPLALVGLIGGPLIFASGIAVLFGLYQQVSVWSGIATVPEFLWEATLGVYLIVKGFRPAFITREIADATIRSGSPSVTA